MRKNKLITPAGILGIIGSSLSLLCGLSLMIIAEALKTNSSINATAFIFIIICGLLLFLGGIFGIIICSLALAENKKKTYSSKGKKLCIVSLIANASLLAILLMTLLIYRLFILDLVAAFILCLLSVIFYGVGISKSIPGTQEQINEALMMAYTNNVVVVSANNTNVPSTPTNANSNGNDDLIASLEKLYNLYQNGVLSKEEYEEKKKVILEKL